MTWTGIAAAPGYAIGPAFILRETQAHAVRKSLTSYEAQGEVLRFSDKVEEAVRQLQDIQETARAKMGDDQADIFETHILVLHDEEFVGRVKEVIVERQINAEAALEDVTQELVEFFKSMDNDYLRERAADFLDVGGRIMDLLTGTKRTSLADFDRPVVLIAHDLSPSDTVQLDRERVVGFATDIGGRTSHSAIMARTMEIPAVVGLTDATDKLKEGDTIIVDGVTGTVIVNPSDAEIRTYEEKKNKFETRKAEFSAYIDAASITADGRKVELAANIGNPGDAPLAWKNGAEGVGLFRTEFLYMGRDSFPSEEEQFEAYKQVAETFGANRTVVIRTLDIGGDKELPYLDLPKEMNPFLGYRAIRLCLDRKDLFKTQLRAILRSSAFGGVKAMYPMIATLQELRAANALLAEAKNELDAKGVAYNRAMEVGIMIEIPAAAIVSDQLAKEVDFFSIGTNDLVQYTLAADRMNERVAHLAQPLNPSVLRLIRMVIDNAHREGKWVGMCGEMAGHLTAIPILLGLGLDEFSMGAGAILPARVLISKLTVEETRRIAEEALNLESAEAVEGHVREQLPIVSEMQ